VGRLEDPEKLWVLLEDTEKLWVLLEDTEKRRVLLEDPEKLWVLLEDLKKLTNSLIRQNAEFLNVTACGKYNDHWTLYA
jgi:hypothetical protein